MRRLSQLSRSIAERVIIVTGAGRGFCAGADMDVLQGIGARGGIESEGPRRDEHQTYTLSIPKPVIAVVNGSCAGLGMVQAVMADVRFAAAGTKFTTAFSRRGLIAEHGMTWLLPKAIGTASALDLLWSSRKVEAEACLRLGLATKVVPPAQLEAETLAFARQLADGPTLDYGCGAGELLELLPAGSEGAEVNREAVEYCRSKGLRVSQTDHGRRLVRRCWWG